MPDQPSQAPDVFTLDPGIDADALRAAFAASGRVQIAPFVAGDAAARLRDHLHGRSDWQIALNLDGKQNREIDRHDWEAMNNAQREALKKLGAPTDLKGFRFFFEQIVVARDSDGPDETTSLLGKFAAFMSSAPVLELIGRITAANDIDYADARATAYGPDHFLTMHHDEAQGSHRRAAYVFGLTEAWRAEWGGLLLFHDERDDVVEGLVPRMNVLTLFDVPRDHSVSLVSPFAPGPRYSVTGWMRAGSAG